MKAQTQNRDLAGHFRPAGYVDPKELEIDRQVAAKTATAERFMALAAALGDPGLPGRLGMKQLENGNWHIPIPAGLYFRGLADGLDAGLRAAGVITSSAFKIKEALEHFRA